MCLYCSYEQCCMTCLTDRALCLLFGDIAPSYMLLQFTFSGVLIFFSSYLYCSTKLGYLALVFIGKVILRELEREMPVAMRKQRTDVQETCFSSLSIHFS
jgi:hypothetical protein